MRKRYRVRLTTTERDFLNGILAHGKAAAHKQRHARILLQTDEQLGPGLTDEAVARAVEVSVPTVQRVRRILVEHGLERALEREDPERIYERKLDGEAEARLIALACGQPPEGRARWTLRLLADRLVELEIVDTISHEAVRSTLKKKRTQTLVETPMVHRPQSQYPFRLPDGGSVGGLRPATRSQVPPGLPG